MARFLLTGDPEIHTFAIPGGHMLRSAVIGTLVACLIGFAVLDAQMGGDGYSEAVVTDESAGTGTDAPAIPAAAPSDAAVSADETASDPQEPAAAQDSWAENRPPAGTPRSLPKRLFPDDNWWNLNSRKLHRSEVSELHHLHRNGQPSLRLGQQLRPPGRDGERQLSEGTVPGLRLLE